MFANIFNFLFTRLYFFNHRWPIRLKAKSSFLQELQILQNRIIRKTGNAQLGTRIRDLHYSFNLSTMGEIPDNVTAKKKKVTRNHDTDVFTFKLGKWKRHTAWWPQTCRGPV
jgi:hypothetical protein